eukprot:Stramenopile-MAST_4_protein_224
MAAPGVPHSGGFDGLLVVFVLVHSLRVVSFQPLDGIMQEVVWLPSVCFSVAILLVAGAALLLIHQPCAGTGVKKEHYANIIANSAALCISLNCWVYGLRNIGAPVAAVFEAGGVCVATIVPACVRPVRTERARARVFQALVMFVGYMVVVVSPAGHGAIVGSYSVDMPRHPGISTAQRAHHTVWMVDPPSPKLRGTKSAPTVDSKDAEGEIRRRLLKKDSIGLEDRSMLVVDEQRSPFFGFASMLVSLFVEHGRMKSAKSMQQRLGRQHSFTAIITLLSAFMCMPFLCLRLASVDWSAARVHPTPGHHYNGSSAIVSLPTSPISSHNAVMKEFHEISGRFTFALSGFVALGYVLPYYMDGFVLPRLGPQHGTDGLVVWTSIVTGIIVDYWVNGRAHSNIMYLVGAGAVCFGSDQLTKAIVSTASSRRLFGQGMSAAPHGIYNGGGLIANLFDIVKPCFNLAGVHSRTARLSPTAHGNNGKRRRSFGLFDHILGDKESIRIFSFVCINVAFMFVELLVGWYSNSLGLISDAGHMLFDNFALFLGLYAAYMSRWPADGANTFGYGRYEVLCAFVNGIFLVFIAFTILFESFDRFGEPPKVYGKHLLWTSIVGFGVNAVGIALFHDHGSLFTRQHGHSHQHGRSRHNHNVRAIFLHIVADALGSMGVIISSLLVKYYDLNIADPICSSCISILIIMSVIPLLKDAGYILMQGTSIDVLENLDSITQKFKSIDRVVSVMDLRVWTLRQKNSIGSVSLYVESSADQQAILQSARQVWSGFGIRQGTTQIKKQTSEEPEG